MNAMTLEKETLVEATHRGLARVWIDFESALGQVPLISPPSVLSFPSYTAAIDFRSSLSAPAGVKETVSTGIDTLPWSTLMIVPFKAVSADGSILRIRCWRPIAPCHSPAMPE